MMPFGPQVEVRVDELDDARVGNAAGAFGVNGHVDRLGDADRVRQLHLALLREARGDDVLRDVSRRVRRRAVDLRRILAGKRAAAVRRRAAVRVDDDLAAGDAGVAVRSADLEASGRVHHEPRARQHFLREHRLDDLLDHRLGQLLLTCRSCSDDAASTARRCRRSSACRRRSGPSPAISRRAAARRAARRGALRFAAAPADARSRSETASASASRRTRSRTSAPGRRHPGSGNRPTRGRRLARCRATGGRSTP